MTVEMDMFQYGRIALVAEVGGYFLLLLVSCFGGTMPSEGRTKTLMNVVHNRNRRPLTHSKTFDLIYKIILRPSAGGESRSDDRCLVPAF